MEKNVTLVEIRPAREFEGTTNGQPVKVKARDIVVCDGFDTFIATGYREMADIALELTHMYRVNLTFGIRAKDGNIFQSCTLNKIAKLW